MTRVYDVCIVVSVMTRMTRHNFFLDPAMARCLKAASRDEEIPQAQIVRKCVKEWLIANGHMKPKAKGEKHRR